MAGKDDAEVILADDDVVEIDISDNPELAEGAVEVKGKEGKVEVDPEPKQPIQRKKVAPEVLDPGAADPAVALKEATAKFEQAELARKAAEATALAERRQREQAEARANQREQEALSAREQVEQHELAIIESGIDTAKRELEACQEEYERAAEAGEFAKMAKIQTRQSQAAAKLDRLTASKEQFEAGERKTPAHEGRVEAVQSQVSPFEQYLATSGFAPVAQTWLRQHPECAPAQVGGNPQANAKMMAGHYAAVAANVEVNSPKYFEVIEEHAGFRQPVSAAATVTLAEEPKTPAAKPKPTPQVSAPASREVPSATTGIPRSTRSVTLSKEQQEAAKISFPSLEPAKAFAQYARNLLELEAEGKMGRLTH